MLHFRVVGGRGARDSYHARRERVELSGVLRLRGSLDDGRRHAGGCRDQSAVRIRLQRKLGTAGPDSILAAGRVSSVYVHRRYVGGLPAVGARESNIAMREKVRR